MAEMLLISLVWLYIFFSLIKFVFRLYFVDAENRRGLSVRPNILRRSS